MKIYRKDIKRLVVTVRKGNSFTYLYRGYDIRATASSTDPNNIITIVDYNDPNKEHHIRKGVIKINTFVETIYEYLNNK